MLANKSRTPLVVLLMLVNLAGAGQPADLPRQTTNPAPSKDTYLRLAAEMEATLRKDVLDVWFPRCVDHENGGFYSNFTRDWNRTTSEGKFSVFQGRMTWIAAQVVIRRPDLKERFLPIVKHGVEFLRNVMWDREQGGFFWGLDDKGQITPRFTDGKQLYGMSFCLYGAAAAYQATRDPAALDLAQRAFRWIERHAHDAKNGGYFEWLTRAGKVVPARSVDGKAEQVIGLGVPIGYKTMNAHLHLLEAFAQLYEVWKDETVRLRLEEMLAITRDKICVEPGVMNLFFTLEWRPIPDHDSYGHDVETAYLMLEAEEILAHSPKHKRDPRTERMSRMLVDHALAYGWDEQYGGFYRDGTTFGRTEDMTKEWWEQVEGLNVLLLMHEKYGGQTESYFKAFQQQWRFIKEHQIDSEFGGMYDTVNRDGSPTSFVKARMWKAAYHDGRALLNVTERLRRLAH